MRINNLVDKIYILVQEESFVGRPYTVYRLNAFGCRIPESAIYGEIPESGDIFLDLKDGRYEIIVDTELADFTERFSVMYNNLSRIVTLIQKLMCPCSTCKKNTKEDYFEAYYRVLGYAALTGQLCGGLALPELQRQGTVFSEEREYEAAYGEFRYNYEKEIERFLVRFYVQLYSIFAQAIQDTEGSSEEVDNVLKLKVLERCFYRLGFNFEEMLCSTTKCDCDE